MSGNAEAAARARVESARVAEERAEYRERLGDAYAALDALPGPAAAWRALIAHPTDENRRRFVAACDRASR